MKTESPIPNSTPTDPELAQALRLLLTALDPGPGEQVLWSDLWEIRQLWSKLDSPIDVVLTLDPEPHWGFNAGWGPVTAFEAGFLANLGPDWGRAFWAAEAVAEALGVPL
ncbi:MAG: hypothetical protein ACE366_16495 [Bradymonadia bacterium]